MRKKLNLIILTVVISFFIKDCYGQYYFNNLYSIAGSVEFDREIHILENENIIACGVGYISPQIPDQIFRSIHPNGNLIWEDHVGDETFGLYSEWTHTSTIASDSLLIVTGTAELRNGSSLILKPYFLKYNIKKRRLKQLKFFDFSTFHIFIYSAILHTDGYIYSAGVEHLDRDRDQSDIILMKLDIDGNLIWKKNIDIEEKVFVNEIDVLGNNLMISGHDSSTKTFIAVIDTAANMLNLKYSVPFASSGTIDIEHKDKSIYYAAMSNDELIKNETLYLAKFTDSLNLVWDTLVPNTSQYEISARRMEVINDKMIILSNITDAFDYTNRRVWSHAAAWSLEGEFLWEHVYFQDSLATHHLDDVEVLANGDMIFMGTVFNTDGQHLWLFSTDSMGCGIQETCYNTVDQYFGLDTMVNIAEPEFFQFSPLQILGNPFRDQLVLAASNHQKSYNIQVHNIAGQLVYEDVLNTHTNLNVATASWQNGIYLLQVYETEKLVAVEKLVKQ